MNAIPMIDDVISYATIDAEGRVVTADPVFSTLNDHAGGGIGQPIAVPALATIARLAHRLGILVSRGVVVGDTDAPVELWVKAEPIGKLVRLAISGWREGRRIAPQPIEEPAAAAIGTDLGWDVDAALRFTYIALDGARQLGIDAIALLGKPITTLFQFEEDRDGSMPLLEAVAQRRPLDRQRALLRASTPRQVVLSAFVRRDPDGGFAGFSGSANLLVDPAAGGAPTPPSMASIAGDGLNQALRTPLARIIDTAETISTSAEGPIQQEYVDYAAHIAHAGRHLLGLVDDLIDVHAIEREDFHPTLSAIDLADVARRAAGLMSVKASEVGVAIARPLPALHVTAMADFRRTLQILVNLIGNAVRYSPEGGVVTVSVTTTPEGFAQVLVADQGRGIDPADHDRVFAKFERLDPLEASGNGLGLYIARRLARAMGGDLTLESAAGEGARFTLSLPTQPARDQN